MFLSDIKISGSEFYGADGIVVDQNTAKQLLVNGQTGIAVSEAPATVTIVPANTGKNKQDRFPTNTGKNKEDRFIPILDLNAGRNTGKNKQDRFTPKNTGKKEARFKDGEVIGEGEPVVETGTNKTVLVAGIGLSVILIAVTFLATKKKGGPMPIPSIISKAKKIV